MEKRKPRKDQYTGCLIGEALGDALGLPAEAGSVSHTRDFIKNTLKDPDFTRPTNRFRTVESEKVFQYTDDTQQARELMQSYVECNGFDPENFASHLGELVATGRTFGWGFGTLLAGERLANGTNWKESGCEDGTSKFAGNGAAMRAAPIGLFFYDDPEKMIEASYGQSLCTHKDKRSIAGAVAIAGSTALALQNDKINTKEFVKQISEWTGKIDEDFGNHVSNLERWTEMDKEEALKEISKSGHTKFFYKSKGAGLGSFVTPTVLWSVLSFLRNPEDYWETICDSMYCGGDVDTTAAMAGAISGAYLGIDAVPSNLSKHLTERGTWGFDELVDLAEKCYDIKHSSNSR